MQHAYEREVVVAACGHCGRCDETIEAIRSVCAGDHAVWRWVGKQRECRQDELVCFRFEALPVLRGGLGDEGKGYGDTSVECEAGILDAERGGVANPAGAPDVGVGSESRPVRQFHGVPRDARDFRAVDGDGCVGGVDVGPEVGLRNDTGWSGARPEGTEFPEIWYQFPAVAGRVEAMFLPGDVGEGFPVEPDQGSPERSPMKEPGHEGGAVVDTRVERVEESLRPNECGGDAE